MKMSKLSGIPKGIHVSSWFCFSVKTGSLILGFFDLLLSIAFIFGIYALHNYLIWHDHIERVSPKWSSEISMIANGIIFYNLLSAFINCAMIAGVLKNEPQLMYPWIYYEFIKFIFGKIIIISFHIIVFFNNVIENNDHTPFNIRIAGLIAYICIYIIIHSVACAIEIYFFVPVVVHCRRLIDMKKNKYSPYEKADKGYIEMGN